MASSMALKLACVVFMCSFVTHNGYDYEGLWSCDGVATKCKRFLQMSEQIGIIDCCSGYNSLVVEATTTAGRRQLCKCVTQAFRRGSDKYRPSTDINIGLVFANLSVACGVAPPFEISANTNCNSVQ
ncbi:hypothetical protein Tsubulata_024299 [Turnera subulata]|uniref:Bifunctional inhibitor/plant lipid transfer protein/seed storage helical domain-containing protein n=1 Tax=Turnera subulata TaxID=218843 RepID=A0A9Q0GFY2_9ROSI|nr:hypothetical protein Tsubulata_024299 [Turnera subulata]